MMNLPPYKNDPFYVSAKSMTFTDEQIDNLENQEVEISGRNISPIKIE